MADAKFPYNFAKNWICTLLHCCAIIGQLNWRKELYIARVVPILFILSAETGVSEPTYGTLIGSLDGDILQYECSGDSEINNLSCSFTQVLLTTKSSPEGLEDELASIPQMLADVSTFEGCEDSVANFEDAISRVERGEPMEDGQILVMDADELEYSKRLVASWAAMCSDRTAESLEALFRFTHEREAITCRPFVNDYRQTFTKVDDGLWVVDDGPTGQCGIVQVSRFAQSEGDGFLWEYTAQRVITNPSGVSETGMSCSVLSDEPVLYTWRSDTHRIDCTFIE